ncbi:MAG: DUF2752 domain-containing protein [Actinomycetota bacterium]
MQASTVPHHDVDPGAVNGAAPRSSWSHTWRRASPLVGGAALGAAALYTARYDPSVKGHHFPGCAFHSLTGLWCPGCGLTRGVHQLITGHPLAAMSYNVFVPLVVLGIAMAWWNWVRTSWDRPAIAQPQWVRRGISTALPLLVVGYGVVRNIPAAPFRSLAP